ncbi:protein eva-1 homolog C-like [Lytechinus variegatus]|uniref:protein eva-1 homolog C-like n=1 Tax=Lytechinus variegatus TaxID=7654 RepID=UPI001BB165AF|nr:protein eva-1 homolog C-like [Lytechinus variegatus]
MCPLPWTSLGTRSESLRSENINCRAADSLQIITDRCEDTPECRIEVKTSLFSVDPCPTTHKYLDVSYKCRPHQFTKVETCEDKHMNVYCDEENQVVAIYNAHFGRLLPGSMECPSYSMHELECQTDDALAQMMQRCHGRRHCAVKAGSKIFGDPCPEDTHKYLIVLYSCGKSLVMMMMMMTVMVMAMMLMTVTLMMRMTMTKIMTMVVVKMAMMKMMEITNDTDDDNNDDGNVRSLDTDDESEDSEDGFCW